MTPSDDPDPRVDTATALIEEFKNILAPSEHGPAHKPQRVMSDEDAELWNGSRAALCLSGGGIRSAAFSLGVLQSLAKAGLLLEFHYLSTVSGGGYTGGWLAAVMHRDGGLATAQRVLEKPGDARLEGLRAYTNFITPSPGPGSADTRAAAVLWLRNVLLNWMVFGPAMLAIAALPALYAMAIGAGLQTLGGAAAGSIGLLALLIATFNSCRLIPAHSFPSPSNSATAGAHYLRTISLGIVLPALVWAILAPVAFSATSNPLPLKFVGPPPPSDAISLLAIGAFAALLLGYFGAWIAVGRQRRPGFSSNFGWWLIASGLAAALLQMGIRLGQSLHAEWLAVLGPLWVIGAHVLQSTIYVGLRSVRQYADLDREWLAQLNSDKLVPALLWAALAAAALLLPLYVSSVWATAAALVSGPGGAWLGSSARSLFGSKTPPGSVAAWLTGILVEAAISAATLVFLALLLMALAEAATGLAAYAVGNEALALMAILVLSAGAACLLGARVNVNRFSLHGVYRNRLVRAFLGTARLTGRNPEPYTKFDPSDNLRMKDLYPAADAMPAGSPEQRDAHEARRGRLFPVVNATLNLTVPKRTAWSERKAAPFTITPFRSGADCLFLKGRKGVFTRTDTYGGGEEEGPVGDDTGGFTLGGAMTISGAAVSPNMGYHTRPAVAFIMTLFDVRLGAWMPNPAKTSDRRRLNQGRPNNALFALAAEMLGRADDQRDNIYLSDGGHFDNLGLYEMLRRECRTIVVIDASEDGGFLYADLGDSVRRAAIDLGAVLEFSPAVRHTTKKLPKQGAYATIAYRSGAVGKLVYLKPWLTADMPADVMAYAAAHTSFPHESTADQFFTESQFESYRHLGAFLGSSAFGGAGSLDSWLKIAAQRQNGEENDAP